MKKIICVILLLAVFKADFFSQNIPTYLPTNGLLAWWPFNGNAWDENIGNDGTVIGATLTTDRYNRPNNAYNFDGDDYIKVSDDSQDLRPINYTISCWVYFNATNISGNILTKNHSHIPNRPEYSILFSYNNGFFKNSILSPFPSGQILSTNFPVNAVQWYHLIDQFDNSNNIHNIYINGVYTNSVTETASIGYDIKDWTIGAGYANNIPFYFFNGKIDDLAIWDRVLTESEITQVYEGDGPPTIVNNIYSKEEYSIYPNPANDILNINNNEVVEIDYSLKNSIGEICKEGKVNYGINSIDIQELYPGIYFLKLGENKVFKVVKL